MCATMWTDWPGRRTRFCALVWPHVDVEADQLLFGVGWRKVWFDFWWGARQARVCGTRHRPNPNGTCVVDSARWFCARQPLDPTKVNFLRRASGLSLSDKVRSSDIRKELGVGPLLLCVERGSAQVVRASCQDTNWVTSCGGLPGMFQLGGRPWGIDPELAWGTTYLIWERLGILQEELESVAGNRHVWNTAGYLHDLILHRRKEMDGWMELLVTRKQVKEHLHNPRKNIWKIPKDLIGNRTRLSAS